MNMELLDKLVQLFGPSGYEDEVLDFCESHVKQNIPNSTVVRDRMGNVIVTIHPNNRNPTVLTAHADQIGFVIKYIDDDGFARFKTIGGWDPAVFLGHRVMLHSEKLDRKVYGVISRRATHLLTNEEQDVVDIDDLWIDFGVFDEDDPNQLVNVGDVGIIAPRAPLLMHGDAISAQALDDRIGVYIALCVADEFAHQATHRSLIVVINRNEEAGNFQAAKAAVESVTDAGALDFPIIAIDVTPSTDQPNIEKEKHGDIVLGFGPAIGVGGLVNKTISRALIDMAERLDIGYQRDVIHSGTGTDMDGIFTIPRGARGGVVYLPCRYLHTPVEMVSINDVANTVDMLLGFCSDD